MSKLEVDAIEPQSGTTLTIGASGDTVNIASGVGSVTTNDGDLLIGTGDTGFRFYDGGDAIIPNNISSPGNRDNAIDLGISSVRYKDLYLGGGLYVGGTGTANKLDDYEEGTWTPTLLNGGVSYTSQTGQYIKVGKLVYFSGNIILSSNNTADTSSVRIGSLPFAVDNTINSLIFTMNASQSSLFDSYHNVGGANFAPTNAINIGDNSNGQEIQYADLQSSGTMVFSGQYIAS